MSKNTGTSELINYFDLGANGDVGIAGSLDVNTIANADTDTDKFLVSDTGIIKYRTGAELLSDIGAAPATGGSYLPLAGGTLTGALNGTSITLSGDYNSTSNSGSLLWSGATNKVQLNANAGTLDFYTGTSGYTKQLSIASTGAATFSSNISINNSGTTIANIGSTSSQGGLDLYSGATVDYNGGALITLVSSDRSGAYTRGELYISAGRATNNTANGFIEFATSATPRMRITSGGNVLIGTTTDAGEKLQVRNGQSLFELPSGTNGAILKLGRSAGSYYWYLGISGATSNFEFYDNNLNVLSNINVSTGVYVPLSDKNKKKDFEPSILGLNEIIKLKPTLYRMVSDSSEMEKQLGFIAQEVKEFIPQAYFESKDFIGLNYNAIIVTMVKAIQEQQEQIQELKNKLS